MLLLSCKTVYLPAAIKAIICLDKLRTPTTHLGNRYRDRTKQTSYFL